MCLDSWPKTMCLSGWPKVTPMILASELKQNSLPQCRGGGVGWVVTRIKTRGNKIMTLHGGGGGGGGGGAYKN